MKKEEELLDCFFDDINGYSLDIYQRKIVLNDNKNILVVAGAGSGKTLTIIGKVKYLIQKKKINPKHILCISFTNETVDNLKEKLHNEVDVFTFHKLSLEILKDYHVQFKIAPEDMLKYVVDEYFESIIFEKGYLYYCLLYFILKKNLKNLTYEELKKAYKIDFELYKKLIIEFISKIKSNGHDFAIIRTYHQRIKRNLKDMAFLIIVLDIYRIYLEELNSTYSIDFDMMIALSSKFISKYGMKRYYKYIIVDEFQDTSMIRYFLIQKIQEECNSNLLCVGDDFQSIYGFSGCNLDLFVKFKKYFKFGKIFYLNNTYRNSLDLVKISYFFIKKNPYQLRKRMISKKRLVKPLKLVYYTRSNEEYVFLNLLEKLYQEGQKEIMILGRYHYDIKRVYKGDLINNYFYYKDMKIIFLTVHASKGLESENIIILNLVNSVLGFPSQIKEDDILKKIFPTKEKYLYADERRLFYVAITRTKNNVYLMTKKKEESKFILEIKKKCEILDI